MTTNRRIAVAAASAAGLTGALLAMPAAQAAPSGNGIAGATVANACSFHALGERLRIRVGLTLGSNGRDVEAIAIRATDNNEDGKYDNNDVRLTKIRVVIRDEDGKKQLNDTVSPSSPGSFDVGSAGEGAGKVTVKVKWRTHHRTVAASCSKVVD